MFSLTDISATKIKIPDDNGFVVFVVVFVVDGVVGCVVGCVSFVDGVVVVVGCFSFVVVVGFVDDFVVRGDVVFMVE